MLDLFSRPIQSPYYYLIVGLTSFSAAVVWTCIGKARARFSGWVYRDKEPNEFWWLVALYYLGGVFFIGTFVYKIFGFSN